MRTKLLLFVCFAVLFEYPIFSQSFKLKKVEVPKTFRQQSTAHVLDSTRYTVYDWPNDSLVIQKEIYLSRVSGAEYLWSEKKDYTIDLNTNTLVPHKYYKQTYLNNTINAPIETYLVYPWNSSTNNWDDTLQFYKLTGDTNVSLDFAIFTYSISKDYDYNQNKFTFGMKQKVSLLNDTCPSQIEMFLLDTTTNQFVPNIKYVMSYDNNYLVDTVYIYIYDDILNQYFLSSRNLMTFSNYKISEEIYQFFDGTNWLNSNKMTYTYNSYGNLILYLNQWWDAVNNDWVNSYKEEKTYYPNQLLKSHSSFNWDNFINEWIGSYKLEKEYDANGNTIKEEYFGYNFEPQSKVERIYNSNNLLINETYSFYDSFNSMYIYNYKIEYFYNSNNKLDSLYQFSYDVYLQNWILWSKKLYNYDSYNEIVLEKTFMNNSGNWEPSDKMEYFYSDITINNPWKPYFKEIRVYPNPANQFIKVNYNDLSEIDEIKIYDLNGKLVGHYNKLSLLVPISISNLNSGTYVIHVVSKNKVYKSKFVKN